MVNCPLCHATHPESVSAKGKPYAYCHESHSTLWLTSPIVRRNLGLGPNNGGYTARENPVYSPDQPRQIVESDGAELSERGDPWVDAQPNRALPRVQTWGHCNSCGREIVVEDLPACDACGEPIAWEE